MRYAKKIKGKMVRAWELGAGSDMEHALIAEGVIRRETDGRYRLFSKEAVNGVGELAEAGDFFKVDEGTQRRFAYPNARAWFLDRHRHVGGDVYVQLPRPMPIWEKGDPPCEAVETLRATGRLRIDETDGAHYFNAELFGAPLSAAADAVIVFYDLERDADGGFRTINFNFVDREVFDRDYTVISD